MSPTSFECVAECKPGYFGEPTISCNPATGFWGSVTGTCRGSSSGCTGTPVSSSGNPLPDPSGGLSWLRAAGYQRSDAAQQPVCCVRCSAICCMIWAGF